MAEYPRADKIASNWDYEIQRSNHFVLEIYNRNSTNVFIPELSFVVKSVQIPNVTIDPLELKRGNETIKVAGSVTVDTGSIVIDDFLDHDTERKFEIWKAQVFNPKSGKMGRHTTYKKDAVLFLKSPCDDVVRRWKLEGIWPTSLEPGEMSHDNSEGRTVSITLSVDKCYRAEVWDEDLLLIEAGQCGDGVDTTLSSAESAEVIRSLS